jgi:predicted nuclease of predicted toxin-antitoxin system
MKFKLDENLPLQIAIDLRARTHDVQTVGEEGLTGGVDANIWQATQREGRILITQDLDFSDTRKFQPGTHHGIVLIRLQSPSRRNLIARTTELFETENVSGWARCFVVVTERKIRVKKPGPARN